MIGALPFDKIVRSGALACSSATQHLHNVASANMEMRGAFWSPICAKSKSASRRPAAAHHEVLLHQWKIGVKRILIVDMHRYPRYLRNAAIMTEVG